MPDTGAPPDCVKTTADMNARIHTCFQKDLTEHTRYGCLSVRSAYADRLGKAFHKLAQKNCTLNGWNPEFLRLSPFGILRRDSSGINHKIRAMHIFSTVSDHHLTAFFPDIVDQVPVIPIAA